MCRIAKFRAFMNNRESASNGCMMRATPMAVWASALTKEDLRKVSNSDVQLTHPNKTSWNAVYIYNFALKYLFEHIEDENRAEDCFRASLKEAETFEAE